METCGTIALTETADISTTFPASSNYFKCLEEDDNPPTVESTLPKEYNLQAQTTVTQSRAQRVSEQQTKREVESVPEVSRKKIQLPGLLLPGQNHKVKLRR